ncbi:TPA: peptidase P60, partial [Kluyvera intermedia]|nr:peptidase P60 [Kluyvera intermedia]
MREKLMAAIREHAAAEYPRECCGVVVQAGRKQRYLRCENISDKPEEHFTLSPADYLNAEKQGEI